LDASDRPSFRDAWDEMNAVIADAPPVRDASCPLTLRSLRCERRLRSRSQKSAFILTRSIKNASHELIGRRLAVSLTTRTHDLRAVHRDGSLDHRTHDRVAPNPVSTCNDEDARFVSSHRRESLAEAGSSFERRDARHALIGERRDDVNAFFRRPDINRRLLRRWGKSLFVSAGADVRDRDSRICMCA
jgi:hypothetical protein